MDMDRQLKSEDKEYTVVLKKKVQCFGVHYTVFSRTLSRAESGSSYRR